MTVQWSVPVWMWPLLLVVAAGAIAWTVVAYRQTRPTTTGSLRRILTGLRATTLVLLVVALAGPMISSLRDRTESAELFVVIEDSGSMDLAAAAADTAGSRASRWDLALRLAAGLDSIFVAREPTVDVQLLRGNGLDPLQQFDLDDIVLPGPDRHGTSLTALVRQGRGRALGRSTRAIVLIADGQETGAAHGAFASSMRGGPMEGIPVHVVGVGDERVPADRAIRDLRHPGTAYAGDEVVVGFSVTERHAVGDRDADLVVSLTGEQGVVASDTLFAQGIVTRAELAFVPRQPGLQAYRLEVSPLANERIRENNAVTLAVDVRKERARILAVAPTPGWDIRFLAQAAARESRLEMVVIHATATGLVVGDSLASWSPPPTAADWRQWDAVVLTEWDGPLADVNWQALDEAVQGGMGLVVVPGTVAGRPGPPPFPPPAELAIGLPVDPTAWRWQRGTFFAVNRSEAGGHPVLEGVDTGTGGRAPRSLAALPPLREWVSVQPRPETTVLLEARERGAAGGDPERPLLVVGRRGDGRTAWFGGRHLWEWAFWESPVDAPADVAGEQAGRRLLRNLLIWAATGQDDSGLSFSGRQTLFQEGERVRLAAQWRDIRGRPVVDRRLSLLLEAAGTRTDTSLVRTFAMQPAADRPGAFDVELPLLEPGAYTVRLTGPGDPPVTGPATNIVVAETSAERSQVQLDRRRLEQLAARADGTYRSLDGPETLAALVADLEDTDWSGVERVRQRRFDLWSNWPFLVVVALLLACEWFLRRRHGLL